MFKLGDRIRIDPPAGAAAEGSILDRITGESGTIIGVGKAFGSTAYAIEFDHLIEEVSQWNGVSVWRESWLVSDKSDARITEEDTLSLFSVS